MEEVIQLFNKNNIRYSIRVYLCPSVGEKIQAVGYRLLGGNSNQWSLENSCLGCRDI